MRVASRHRLLTKVRYHSTSKISPRAALYEKNASVNAFSHIYEPSPQDGEEESGSLREGPLAWTTVAIKDNICTSDMPTTCSSAMLENFTSPFDATVVRLLKKAGAEIVGKTNCDEFGMGSLNIHSIHGPVVNPFQAPHLEKSVAWKKREKKSAGGSSGGSAAAVAAEMCNIAIATDTGGSIRLPASYCGVVGLKPSYGLISRWGVVSYADSLDCVGILSKSGIYVRMAFDVLNKYDPNDPTAAPVSLRERVAADYLEQDPLQNGSNLKDLRVGVPQEYFTREVSPSILNSTRKAIKALQTLGAQIIPVSLPSTSYALSAYYVLASAEASSNLARYDGIEYGMRVEPTPGSDLTKTSKLYAHTRSEGFGEEVKKRVLLGIYALTADAFDNYFLQAQKVRQLVRNDFDRVFRWRNRRTNTPQEIDPQGVDVLIHPSAICIAPPLPRKGSSTNPLDSYLQDVMTVPASLAGLPAISTPVPQETGGDKESDGWPVGVSIVGQWGYDRLLMDVAILLEYQMAANA
uniref:Glutamyl-tRNA(Gln) amidotransferase subunit A, mitochondrial n=1 Tax=Moniliophthora roreri TaxID=221103 RepID=A0A0W0GE96_MONRR